LNYHGSMQVLLTDQYCSFTKISCDWGSKIRLGNNGVHSTFRRSPRLRSIERDHGDREDMQLRRTTKGRDRTILIEALRRRAACHCFLISIIFGACLFSGRSTHGYRQRIEASQLFLTRRFASYRGASPALLAGHPPRLRSGCGGQARSLASRCWTLRHR
jgi:hypothetical protein